MDRADHPKQNIGAGDMDAGPPMEADHAKTVADHPISWRHRIKHFTWTYFTLTMATGGIANVLYTGMHSPLGKT